MQVTVNVAHVQPTNSLAESLAAVILPEIRRMEANAPAFRSRILTSESVANTRRTWGAALRYYPAMVEFGDATMPALFTRAQIDAAVKRARANPEDASPTWCGS